MKMEDMFPVPAAKGRLVSGLKYTALENLSTTVRMVVFPSNTGKLVTKSTVMCDQGCRGVEG